MTCSDCGKSSWRLKKCNKCQQKFCTSCIRYFFPEDVQEQVEKIPPLTRGVCTTCFTQISTLDFSSSTTILKTEGYNESNTNNYVFFLAHGGLMCRESLRPLAQSIIKLCNDKTWSAKCVLIDMPGHGTQYDAVNTLASLDSTIDYLGNIMDKEAASENDKIVMVGHSMSGYILYPFASSRSEDSRIRLVCTTGSATYNVVPCLFTVMLFLSKYLVSWQQMQTMLLSQVVTKNNIKNSEAQDKSEYLKVVLDTVVRPGMSAFVNEAMGSILSDCRVEEEIIKLSTVKIPVLLVNGTDDSNIRVGDSPKMVQIGNGNVTLVKVDGADHQLPTTHPNRFAQEIVNILE